MECFGLLSVNSRTNCRWSLLVFLWSWKKWSETKQFLSHLSTKKNRRWNIKISSLLQRMISRWIRPSTEINPCYEVILVLTSNNKSLPWFALIDFPSTNKKTQLNIEKQRNTVAFIMTHKTNQRKNSVSPVIEVLPLWCNLPLKINWTGDLLLISWFEYDHILYAICLCIRTLFDFMTCIFLAKTDNSDLHLGHQATILRKVKDTSVRVITGKGVPICEIIEYMSNGHFREWCFNELI